MMKKCALLSLLLTFAVRAASAGVVMHMKMTSQVQGTKQRYNAVMSIVPLAARIEVTPTSGSGVPMSVVIRLDKKLMWFILPGTENYYELTFEALGKLQNEIKQSGLNLELTVRDDGLLDFRHKSYGSEPTFSVSSSTAGLLSSQSRVMEGAVAGQDIAGTIGGEVAIGEGRNLTGAEGTRVEGLEIRYAGDVVSLPQGDPAAAPDAPVAGRVAVFQNSLLFQIGPNAGQTVSVSLVNTNTRVLGRGVPNESGYVSLSQIDIRSAQGAVDAQKLVDQAIDEINVTRAELGAFQKNSLEANLRQLRINAEELTNAESVIRDADMAKEITIFTRNSIMVQSATAMLAQANQVPQTVLSLLG